MDKMKHDSSTIARNNLGEEWFEEKAVTLGIEKVTYY